MVAKKPHKVRINVIFPSEVLEELRRLVAPRQRSQLIVEATADKLALLRQQEAVKRAAGAWTDDNHPDLKTDEDLERWLAEIRGSWRARQQLFDSATGAQ